MSKYKGLFTFDVENHRYLPVEQADGLIAEMDYHPEQEPLIKDEKIRKAVRAWSDVLGVERATYSDIDGEFYSGVNYIRLGQVNRPGSLKSDTYTIAELCGEGEE